MNEAEKQELLGKLEKEQLIKDLKKLNKGLTSYKKRQEKYLKMKFTEGQKNSLDALRLRLKRDYRLNKQTISKYGNSTKIKVFNINWDVFDYSLQQLNMTPKQFTALDRAINAVITAIERIESTPVASTDWREISIKLPVKEHTKEADQLLDIIQLHPKIIEVSKSLFETQHYAQAILEAFKAVNNFVKEKTGLSLDGKDLMSKVFREEGPIIKLNELKTRSEKDEQEGFKFLFMGAMVGIRNPKAHNNVIQIDPLRTLEYLSFASLLMKRAEEGEIDREQT